VIHPGRLAHVAMADAPARTPSAGRGQQLPLRQHSHFPAVFVSSQLGEHVQGPGDVGLGIFAPALSEPEVRAAEEELRRDGLDVERWNMLHPNEKPRLPYINQCLADAPGVFVAASDYMKALPDSIARWLPGPLTSLGTDGFGRSDGRKALRHFFEVDWRHVTLAALASLARQGDLKAEVVLAAMEEWEIDPEKANPMMS